MSTSASLVVGLDGSTTKAHSSRGISSPADRAAFLVRRRSFDVIIVGGNTARNEGYSRTPVPLVIISRSAISPVPENELAHLWNMPPIAAIERAGAEFGPNVLIEAGVSVIEELLAGDLIDSFFLTVTPASAGENLIDWRKILEKFAHIEKSDVDGTLFFHAHN